jgi:hypothetical protein
MKIKLSIEMEKYYAVYYTESWYIGRVIKTLGNKKYIIKFLKEELGSFIWPSIEDRDEVEEKFILAGPIALKGQLPFNISQTDREIIQKEYRIFKKTE